MLKLKLLREKKGVSQKEVALFINKTQQAYGKYENDLAEPDIATLKKLAEYFNVSLDYLLDFTPAAKANSNRVNNKLIDKISHMDEKTANEVQQFVDFLLSKVSSKSKYA